MRLHPGTQRFAMFWHRKQQAGEVRAERLECIDPQAQALGGCPPGHVLVCIFPVRSEKPDRRQ
jgi:hypothetical protein